jgi:hypothetical protein
VKRAPFIGAASAAFLAGCGGSHVMRALPGVAPQGAKQQPPSQQAIRMVPTTADPVSANVLNSPIIGEARRFDGAAAPAGWMLAQGQTLKITDDKLLFSILGTNAGGDGRTSFMLPAPKFGLIVAIAGTFPSSPKVLASTGRQTNALGSLGPNARPAPPRMAKPPSEKLLADRRLLTSQVRVGSSSPVAVSSELSARIGQAGSNARETAVAALSASSRASLDAAVQRAVTQSTNVNEAVSTMTSVLTDAEAYALVRINDAMIGAFNDRWAGDSGQNVRLEAAVFLIGVSITREQSRAMYARERAAGG